MFGKPNVFDILKIFFRVLIGILVAAVFVVLFWRFLTSRVPAELKTLSPNDMLSEAYAKYGDDLKLVTQEQNTITRAPNNYGYFTVCEAVFIPEAKQLQLLVRYNDSTLKALQKDYNLDFTPDSSEDWYDITLVTSRDLTPDNPDDNLTNDPASVVLTRIPPTLVSARTHSGRHSYRRLVFDGVELDDLMLAVYADFYYKGDIAYESSGFDIYRDKAYGTLCLYAYTEASDNVTRPLSAADKKALAQ